MCGILALLDNHSVSTKDLEKLVSLVDARGCDYSSDFIEHQTRCGTRLTFKSSVLHLMGHELQKQPVRDSYGNILLFNGQMYAYENRQLDKDCSDTQLLSDMLKSCKTAETIVSCISKITGPFAFVYWSERLNTLFYGRDLFGRKSLCTLNESDDKTKTLASVACQLADSRNLLWSEVDCSGIHCIPFDRISTAESPLFLRQIDSIFARTKKCHIAERKRSTSVMVSYGPAGFKPLNEDTKSWTDYATAEHERSLQVFEEVLLQSIDRHVRYNKTDCLECRKISKLTKETQCKHSKVAIAFSGGIDSTILASAIDRVIDKEETIDLVNVSFKEDAPDRLSVRDAIMELVKVGTGRNWRLILCDISKEVLKSDRESVIRHLIHPCDTVVDDSLGCGCWYIGRAKGRSLDSSKVPPADLATKYDLFCRFDPNNEKSFPGENSSYTSPASMMFVGSGIDEQLGGYSSHRAAYSSSGIKGVVEEISFQMRRISTRNLGRDDRVYSDHGRDMKIPYLDETLVSFLNSLPVGKKMDLSKQLDLGPKLLIRKLAMKWSLHETSRRVKRALQFGTRIANLENTKEKGGDKCVRLLPDAEQGI